MPAEASDPRRVAFLDRDGTVTVDIPEGYTHRIEDFAFEEGAIEGMRHLQEQGFLLVITTGQSGIGRGYYTEEQYRAFMDHLDAQLKEAGINLSGIYHCPHHPTKAQDEYRIACGCRKPKPGMIQQAVQHLRERDIEVDLEGSYVFGDKTDDGMMANVAGCRAVLVRCESGKKGEDGTYSCTWSHEADNLEEAARWVGKQSVEA